MIIRNVAEAKKKVKTGVQRKATVIGIYEHFVHVQLKSGVCESVLWADLINASEEDKR